MSKIKTLHIIALAAHGEGISGGDRIFIELARRWSNIFPVQIYVWEEGEKMLGRQNLKGKNLKINLLKVGVVSKLGFIICYFFRILKGIKLGLTLKLENNSGVYLYNASEFWMDSFTCAILKVRFKNIKWIATWYQTAPNPIIGFKEGDRDSSHRLKAFFYWIVQFPVKMLVNAFADKVLVNNEDERKRFPNFKKKDVLVMIGAVPLKDINKYIKSHKKPKKVYEGVFQGRFHAQKGVVELIEIWGHVVKRIPRARLAMIGDGPLMKDVKNMIRKLKLQENVELLGYVFDGDKKYSTFNSGMVALHPAFYDSGGMATAEAMAFGLPAVGFKLKAYESYYPEGMIKVSTGNKEEFADAVISLLNNREKYKKMASGAKRMIEKSWSWDYRANQILNQL